MLPAVPSRLEERAGLMASVREIATQGHDGRRQRDAFLFFSALALDPRRAAGEVCCFEFKQHKSETRNPRAKNVSSMA